MAIVTSRHTSPLGLPVGGPVLRPGVPTKVERWSIIKGHSVVRAWLAAKVIEAEEEVQVALPAQPAPASLPPAPEPVSEEGDLPSLRDQYKELFGKQPFMGWDAATLREKIDAKLAE